MSTKIYNGYRIRGIDTSLQFQRWADTLRKKIAFKAAEIQYNEQGRLVAEFVDTVACGYKLPLRAAKYALISPVSPLGYSASVCLDLFRKSFETKLKADPLDLSCSFACFFLENAQLALLFTEQPELQQIFESDELVEEFSYWDNSDLPENMDGVEWTEREQLWEKALWNNNIPSISGVTVECTTVNQFFPYTDAHKLVKHIPPFADRVESQLQSYFHRRYMKEEFTSGDHFNFNHYRKWIEKAKYENTEVRCQIESSIPLGIIAKDMAKKYGIECFEGVEDNGQV